MKVSRDSTGWSVTGRWYRLSGTIDGTTAILDDAAGQRWAELRLLGAADRTDAVDETFEVRGPEILAPPPSPRGAAGSGVDGARSLPAVALRWALDSSIWAAALLVLDLTEETVAVHLEIEGHGDLAEVSLLGGRAVQARGSGRMMSGAWFRSLVSAAPADPGRIVTPVAEGSSTGVASGAEPGRGRWFFSPAPFVVAGSRQIATEPTSIPAGPWLGFAVDTQRGAAAFTEVAFRASEHGFALVLDYDGHTRVDGAWRSPALVLTETPDPYEAIAAQRRRLPASRPAVDPVPAWWREPIFCGWGAQCGIVAAAGRPMAAAPAEATQLNYDAFLGHLEGHGIVPGTIVIDDKWQASYGANEPDAAKWPDLAGWIGARHGRGQRVLLWYKAWDPEGLPAALCVRNARGSALGVDPTSPDGERALRRTVRAMLGPDGLAADGLKIDFTARTPTGHATALHGSAWGVDLLGRLLDVIADEARLVKPDALLVAHTVNSLVASSVGMIRLNDALRLDDPVPARDIVPSMRHRAAVVRAALPDHLIDTDDWSAPDLAGWRAYAAAKTGLGVPALYYATGIDRTGEGFEERDYALIRETWAEYRSRNGLPGRGPSR